MLRFVAGFRDLRRLVSARPRPRNGTTWHHVAVFRGMPRPIVSTASILRLAGRPGRRAGGGYRGDPPDAAGPARLGPGPGGGASCRGAAGCAPVIRGRPLGGPGPRVLAALASGQPARAGAGEPVPGGPVAGTRPAGRRLRAEAGRAALETTPSTRGHRPPFFRFRRAGAGVRHGRRRPPVRRGGRAPPEGGPTRCRPH